jgi:hypothetical protein
MSISAAIGKLHRIRGVYTPEAAREKLDLMEALRREQIPKASLLGSFHQSLCFIRAFADGVAQYQSARQALQEFPRRIACLSRREAEALSDTGIEGSRLHYRFSYDVAVWLARRCTDEVEVDWDGVQSFERLDELLRQIVLPVEADYYASGKVSEREWISLAKGDQPFTDFRWLMVQLGKRRSPGRILAEMYDAADLPLSWRPGPKFAKGTNALALDRIKARNRGMRNPRGRAGDEIERPLRKIRRLRKFDGENAIATAMAALAVRHRETYHFNHANPEEVYDADVGYGVHILVYGLLPGYRFSLETTMGYLILANDMPVGYGGASAIFHQANTGINIFDEYRRSEAPYLWVQVMRTYHQLFGCRHFVVNPYQIGAGNAEALRSGAFWFYYRLGFRPVEPDIASLADSERSRAKAREGYRSDIKTLKRLTRCDMHLRLSGARKSEFFEEEWLEVCAAGASAVLSGQKNVERRSAARDAADGFMKTLGTDTYRDWAKNEQRALLQQAPIMSLIPDLRKWSRRERVDLVKLIRAKGGVGEKDYINLMRKHDRLRRSLARYCRNRTD